MRTSLESTYKELKLSLITASPPGSWCLESTYKELKLHTRIYMEDCCLLCLESTYKELKPGPAGVFGVGCAPFRVYL